MALLAAAQETPQRDYGDFTLEAQVRARGEIRTGLGTKDEDHPASNMFANDRVRLGFGWERNNISLKVSLQHAGNWMDAAKKYISGNIAVHEAWATMDFGPGFFAQVGRQEIAFDDGRLFGEHDWSPAGRTHDALRLGWANDRHQIHAIASFNQTGDVVDDVNYFVKESPEERLYKNMQTLWYHFGNVARPFGISLLFSNQGVSDAKGNGTNYIQTFGTYMNYTGRKFLFDISLYYQTGTDRAGADLRAFLMSGNLGLQCSPKWKITVGDDYLSGSDGMPGTNRTFNTLYGSHHEFFGSMDYVGFNAVPLYGLNDVHAKATYRRNDKFDMNMGVHWLAMGRPINNYLKNPIEELTDPEKIKIMRNYYGKYRFSQSLGGEIDVEARWHVWQDITLRAGYSMMIASETMQLFKGEDTGTVHNWGWVSFDINPIIFSTRNRR